MAADDDDRRADHSTRSRIDELTESAGKLVDEALPQWREELEAWQRSIERRVSWALKTLGVVVLLFGIGVVIVFLAGRSLYGRQADTALDQAQQAQAVAVQIQAERVRSLELSCQETNDRNVAAKKKAAKFPKEIREVVETFVDSITPYRANCPGYASSRVGTPGGTAPSKKSGP